MILSIHQVASPPLTKLSHATGRRMTSSKGRGRSTADLELWHLTRKPCAPGHLEGLICFNATATAETRPNRTEVGPNAASRIRRTLQKSE